MRKVVITLSLLALLWQTNANAYIIHYRFYNRTTQGDVILKETTRRHVTTSPGDIFVPAGSHRDWLIEIPSQRSEFVYQLKVTVIDNSQGKDQGEVCRLTDQVDAENPFGLQGHVDLGLMGSFTFNADCSNPHYDIPEFSVIATADKSERSVTIQFDDPSPWATFVNSLLHTLVENDEDRQ